MLFDQLIGAGCVDRVRAAWVGNVITGSGYNFRHAVESGALAVEDHSNLTIAMALRAGAMGLPFMPTRTALGSDLFSTNSGLQKITCPFTGTPLAAVAAIVPDVALVHVQRSDEFGNSHAWGNIGVMRDACLASRHVLSPGAPTPRPSPAITTVITRPSSTIAPKAGRPRASPAGRSAGWMPSASPKTT